MPKQILLVDDSVTIHRVVELTFAHEDYKVTAVKNVDDGLSKARELRPDIVLADAGMPGKTGYDLCAALRADGQLASVPCLILTGNFSPYDDARGSKAGADGYVVKPFETQALIDKVNDAVAKKGARAAAAPKVEPTTPRREDDSLEIAIEGGPTRPSIPAVPPTPAPATRPAPTAPPPRPPTSAPTARTMMGMPAPTVTAPPPKPMTPEPLSKPLSMVAAETPPARPTPPPAAPPPPAPVAAAPASRAAAAMPQSVPQMPRAPMIPGVPTPTAPVAAKPEAPRATPKATLMGIPTVNPANLPPGAVPLPPTGARPPAPWAPPVPSGPAHPPATPAAPAHTPPAPSPAMAPVVSAVAERAVADISARGADYEAVAKLSRDVIEKIAWEVVPELAETIIREQLDRLVAERNK